MRFDNVTLNITTDEDRNDPSIPVFDYTKLTALNTCPRWGLVRYDQHKRMPGEGRSMALEAGSASHECYSAIRFFELLEYGREKYGEQFDAAVVDDAGRKLLGNERYDTIKSLSTSAEDVRRRVNSVAIYTANTSGFYDDPSDRRRTLSNMEASLIAYIDRLELGSRIPYVNWETGFVGIEVPFDVTLTFVGVSFDGGHTVDDVKIRYIGRIDGIHYNEAMDDIEIEENKTASRLDNSWQEEKIMTHQVTGYCIASSCVLDRRVDKAVVRGMMIPLPRSYDLGGVVNLPVDRDDRRFQEWFKWVWHTYTTQYLPYKDNPLDAPEYTHSCNRYFRPCSFIPLCAMAEPEERELTFSQMVHDEWSPLDERE